MKWVTILFTTFLILAGKVHAQQSYLSPKREIYKVYETNESGKRGNKNSVLIFFNDNTFINYGVGDGSCWYTSGRWLSNKEMYMCRTYNEIRDTIQLVKDIRETYIPQQKNFQISPGFPLVKISYKDYIFKFSNNDLYDSLKDMYYYQR